MINLIEELKNTKIWDEVLEELVLKDKEIPSQEELNDLYLTVDSHLWGKPRLVQIPKSDGKSLRDVYIFNDSDSLLLKVINKILFNSFREDIHKDVFSYIKGRRTMHAAKQVQDALGSTELVGVKLDLSNFFLEVNMESIIKSILSLVEDQKSFKLLYDLFSVNGYVFEGKEHEMYMSLMPGSSTSSFFSNFILKPIDNLVEKSSEVYARYSDDLIFFCKTKEDLDSLIEEIRLELVPLGLTINENKVQYFTGNEEIDFLGLRITKDKIRVNSKFTKKIKKAIKKICKEEERSTKYNKVENACKRINKFLYGEIFIPALQHSSTRISYAFSNVDCWEDFRELDFYIADQLRYVHSGKHNKTYYHRITMDNLANLGFVSVVKMYHLFKMDKDIYVNEVSIILNRKIIEFNSAIKSSYCDFTDTRIFNDFSEFYAWSLDSNKSILVRGNEVQPKNLEFNPRKGIIEYRGHVIAKGDRLVEKDLGFMDNRKPVKVLFLNELISSIKRNDDNLMSLYLESNVLLGKSYTRNSSYYRKYKAINIINFCQETKQFNFEEESDVKVARFASQAYFTIYSSNSESNEPYFRKIKYGPFTLIINNKQKEEN